MMELEAEVAKLKERNKELQEKQVRVIIIFFILHSCYIYIIYIEL